MAVAASDPRHAPARDGLIFVNPSSGPKATGAAELTARFANAHVEECAPDTFVERIEELAGTNIEYIGVAGGDGSIRCVAEHLVAEGGTPSLLAIPAGTRNHFAKDVGIADLDAAQAAAKALFTRWIDVGDVNGHVFVNNSSIGVYPRLVVHRERTERRHSKRVAALLAAWHQLREGRKLSVDVDGEHVRAWLVFVGNGCYGDSLLDLTGREHLDRNELDVRIAHAEGKLSRLRIATAVLFGRLDRSPLIDRRVCREVTLDLGARPIAVALDGEVEMIRSPLRYVSNAQALSVVVRPDAP